MVVVMLTAANMGDVDKCDFDAWAEFVDEKIDDECGFAVRVEKFRFNSGEPRDSLHCGTSEQYGTVRTALANLWDEFCGFEWESRVAVERELAQG